MEEYGLFGLFLATFASSTILPLPSELVVATFVALHYNPYVILLIASIGNVLGSLTTYALGYFGVAKILRRLSKIDSQRVRYFSQKSSKYGSILAFLSFLPIFGDLFTLALGLAKYNLYKTMFFIALGKTLRYALIIFGTEEASKWFF